MKRKKPKELGLGFRKSLYLMHYEMLNELMMIALSAKTILGTFSINQIKIMVPVKKSSYCYWWTFQTLTDGSCGLNSAVYLLRTTGWHLWHLVLSSSSEMAGFYIHSTQIAIIRLYVLWAWVHMYWRMALILNRAIYAKMWIVSLATIFKGGEVFGGH